MNATLAERLAEGRKRRPVEHRTGPRSTVWVWTDRAGKVRSADTRARAEKLADGR